MKNSLAPTLTCPAPPITILNAVKFSVPNNPKSSLFLMSVFSKIKDLKIEVFS
jgi:hypothetical protein